MNMIDPLGLEDYSMVETSAFLYRARLDAMYDNYAFTNLLDNHTNLLGGGKYDFKNSGSTFDVPGRGCMEDAEFGNYIAGMAAAAAGDRDWSPMLRGSLAGVDMLVGGIVFDAWDGGPTYFDNDGSHDDLMAGFVDGAYIHHHGWGSYLRGEHVKHGLVVYPRDTRKAGWISTTAPNSIQSKGRLRQ